MSVTFPYLPVREVSDANVAFSDQFPPAVVTFQLIKVFPVFVVLGSLSVLSIVYDFAVTAVPPSASYVIVYVFAVHPAVRVRLP